MQALRAHWQSSRAERALGGYLNDYNSARVMGRHCLAPTHAHAASMAHNRLASAWCAVHAGREHCATRHIIAWGRHLVVCTHAILTSIRRLARALHRRVAHAWLDSLCSTSSLMPHR